MEKGKKIVRNFLKFLSMSTSVLLISSMSYASECKNCLADGAEIDAVKQFKEVKDKEEINKFRDYWKREIRLGQKEGPFSAFVQPISDSQDMIVTQMKTALTCNTASGKECDTKVILRDKKSGSYRTIFSGVYLNKDKDKMTLHGVDGKMPLIKVWNLEYEYDAKKKFYDLSATSPKPKYIEVIDPRGSGAETSNSPSKSQEKKNNRRRVFRNSSISVFPFFAVLKDVFGIRSAFADEGCANGMVTPSTGPITSGFGQRILNGKLEGHGGMDYGIPIGTSLPAIADGVVYGVHGGCESTPGNHLNDSPYNECHGGYGNYVVIKLNNGDFIYYAHLSEINVTEGQTVSAGTPIAKSGNSGRTTGPHLHFEVRQGGNDGSNRVDPATYLDSCGAVAWDGTGEPPGEGNGGSSGGEARDRFQVENLPWYTGGDDTLSDERYKELFEDEEQCN